MRRIFDIIVMGTFAVTAAEANGGLVEGEQAFEHGQYDTAFNELMPLAEERNPLAQYYVGLMYLGSLGVPGDSRAGLNWLTRAAEQGLTAAQLDLALLYERGQHVGQDYQRAADWMLAASQGGNPDAQYYLGVYFGEGRGVVQSYDLAYEWIIRSVEYDIAHETVLDALLYLGAALEWGRGYRQDLVAAYKWFALAASFSIDNFRIHTEAGRALDALSLRMTPAQLAQAQSEAQGWRAERQHMTAVTD
jgi:uncharacterized protein